VDRDGEARGHAAALAANRSNRRSSDQPPRARYSSRRCCGVVCIYSPCSRRSIAARPRRLYRCSGDRSTGNEAAAAPRDRLARLRGGAPALIAAPMFLVRPDLVWPPARPASRWPFPAPTYAHRRAALARARVVRARRARSRGAGRAGALNLVAHSTYDRSPRLELASATGPARDHALGTRAVGRARARLWRLVIATSAAWRSRAGAEPASTASRSSGGPGGHTPHSGLRVRNRPCAASSTASSCGRRHRHGRRSARPSCSRRTSSTRHAVHRRRREPRERPLPRHGRARLARGPRLSRALTGADAWYLRESIVAAASTRGAHGQGQGGLARLPGPAQGVEGPLVAGQGRGLGAAPSSPSRDRGPLAAPVRRGAAPAGVRVRRGVAI